MRIKMTVHRRIRNGSSRRKDPALDRLQTQEDLDEIRKWDPSGRIWFNDLYLDNIEVEILDTPDDINLRANGTINKLRRAGWDVFEAIYAQSYRHTFRRLSPGTEHHWMNEHAAVRALIGQAARDGASIAIQIGSGYEGYRQRKQGDVLTWSPLS